MLQAKREMPAEERAASGTIPPSAGHGWPRSACMHDLGAANNGHCTNRSKPRRYTLNPNPPRVTVTRDVSSRRALLWSYRPHTDSETKTVTIEPNCEDTMVMHMGPGPCELQGVVSGWPHTKPMTLSTQIAQMAGGPTAGPSATGAGCDAQSDHCGSRLAPADEVMPPSAGDAWPPHVAPASRPQWLCTWARVPLAAWNCTSLAKIRPGSDGAEHWYGSVKRKYGTGSMTRYSMESEVRTRPDPGRGSIRSYRSMRA